MHGWNLRIIVPREALGMTMLLGLVLAGHPDLALVAAPMALYRSPCPCLAHGYSSTAELSNGIDR
jgi:hypothetical protein